MLEVARASRPRCRAHGRDARATTRRFMGSLHAFFVAHWDQEPEIRKLFGIKPSVFRFMESLHAFFVAHWDQEPEIRKLFGIKPSVFRFMERASCPENSRRRLERILRDKRV